MNEPSQPGLNLTLAIKQDGWAQIGRGSICARSEEKGRGRGGMRPERTLFPLHGGAKKTPNLDAFRRPQCGQIGVSRSCYHEGTCVTPSLF